MNFNNYKMNFSAIRKFKSNAIVYFSILLLLCATKTNAQISGTIAIPSVNYPTIKVAIDSLNLYGVTGGGGVTFNVAAGYTEPLTSRLDLTATGNAADQIIFQKSGAGANPLLTAYAGSQLASAAAPDGMWSLNGSDYITIDGINLAEAAGNTTTTLQMEYGYGLFKASATDGANNNTIKNCVITLNRNNTVVAGVGFITGGTGGSMGIVVAACSPTTGTAVTAVTSVSGASSNNKFYSNTIQNVHVGIALTGYAGASPFTLCDFNNDIGGTSASTGNSIINFGGGTTPASACAAVYFSNQWSLNCSYNTVNNNTGTGINHAASQRGIWAYASSVGASATINNNSITIQGGSSTTAIDWCIDVEMAQSGASGNTISVSNNTISATKAVASTAAFTAIWVNSAASTVNITGNTISNFAYAGTGVSECILSQLAGIGTLNINNNNLNNISLTGATGSHYSIGVTATVTTALNINGNNLNTATLTGVTSKIFRNIYVSAAVATCVNSISSNNFSGISWSGGTPTGEFSIIYAIGAPASWTISSNTLTGSLTVPTTGTMYFIYNSQSTSSGTVSNNNLTGTGVTRTGASGATYGYYNASSPTGTFTFSGNTYSNITQASSSGLLYGIYLLTSTSCQQLIQNNTFSNFTTGSGTLYGINHNYGNTGSEISGNTVSNLNGAGIVSGIRIGSTASITLDVFNNTVSGITTTGASAITGIEYTAGTTTNIYKNKIYNLNANNAGATAIGLSATSGTTTNIYNNLIGDLKSNAAITGVNQIIGLSITGGTTVNAHYNTVYLNATTAGGANFGSSAISVNATPTTITLRNNIFINNSTPTGTGLAVAYRRASTVLTNYSSSSNNNLLYAGVPSASKLIFYDGTNSDQTIMAFKIRVFPADANTGSENPTFLSTTGASANFLHIDPSVATNVESGAANIAGVTNDYDLETRQGNVGYVGTGTAPDIGADEFNGTPAAALAPPINFTFNTATTNSFNITWDDNSVGEAGFVVFRSLNIGGPFTTIVGAVTSTTSVTTGTTYSLPQTGLLGNTTYYYQIVANNFSSSAPLSGNASTLSCGSGLAGTYLIPGAYASITAAIADLQTNGLSAPVILELDPSYTGAGETYPLTFGSAIQCLGATNTLTLRPAASVTSPLLITSANTTATIDINGGNFVTIDGRPGGVGTNKYLVIENTSTTAASAGNAILIRNEASNNTVTYCDVRSANGNAATSSTALTIPGGVPGAIVIGTTSGAFGNDNNTISFCDIHSLTPGGNLGVGIFAYNATTAGSYANNDNGVIDNCNIYDYYLPTSASAGLIITFGNNSWTVTNNRLFQQSVLNFAAGTQAVRGIWITPNTGSLTSASGFVISGNYIGGNASNGTGSYTMTGTANYTFRAMDVSVGIGAATSIQNNTVTNMNITGGFSGNSVYGIDVNNGNVNIGTVTGNLIGSTTTNGAITITTTVTNGSYIALRSGAGSAINFSNNIVSGIDMIGNATTVSTGFNGIAASGGTNITVNNNTIGSSSLANSINMVSTSSTSATSTAVRGIICNSGGAGVVNSVTNNLVANINSNYNGTGATNTMVGISVTTGTSTISNNIIRDLTTNSVSTGGSGTPACIGIAYTSTGTSTLISNNTIHSLKLTNPANTVATQVTGIFISTSTSGTHLIERNFIHSLSLASTTNSAAVITGIDLGVSSGVTRTVINNMIRLGLDETGASVTSPCTIRGITKNVPNSNIWFNSIYIGGTGVGTGTTNTFAIARTATATDDWRNNVLVNERSNATTGGKHYAININSAASLTLNYNDYYGTGTGYVFGFDGTADVPAYSANWVAGDASSYSFDPLFINPTGNAGTVNLHIDPVNPTIVEGTGINIPAVTNDFDNQTRSALTPTDLGADAGNFVNLLCSGNPPAGNPAFAGNANALCLSGSKTITLSGYATAPGYTYQWQESTTQGGPYTNVTGGTGGTSITYTTPTLTQTTYYICVVTCSNGGASTPSSEIAVVVNNPQVISSTGGNRCGTGTVTLCATPSPGATINWYSSPTGGSPLSYPYYNIPVTGFNNDIVANGVGTNSIEGTTYPAIGMDGALYTFIDSTYKYVSTNALPTCFMPSNNLVPSAITSGLVYQLQSYTANNAMSIANQSTGYTSPLPNTETLNLVTPASYGTLKVLYESVVNSAPLNVDVTVTFTDATTQTFNGITCVNWFTVSAPAFSGMGRTTPAGAIQCGSTPNLFEMSLNIDPSNYSKQVQNITFTIPTVLSGTTASTINYFHALAVGGNAPLTGNCFTTPVISSTTTYYAEANVAGGSAVGGRLTNVAGSVLSAGPRGIIFNTTDAVQIDSVGFMCSGVASAVTIQLYNSGGTATIGAPVVINIPANAGTSTTPVLLTFAAPISIPAAGTYRLFVTAVSPTGNVLWYEFSGVTGYPYNVGSDLTITSSVTSLTGTASLTTYYYFYKLVVQSGCVGTPRTAVVATITTPPSLSVTPAKTVCSDEITMLNVTSPSANYDSITWAPLTHLYTDAAATIPYTGGNEDTVYFKASTHAAYSFTCTGNNTVTPFCSNTATTTVYVHPASVSITTSAASLCFSGSVTLNLNPAGSYATGSIKWQSSTDSVTFTDIPGATSASYTTPVIDTTTHYRVILTNSNGDTCTFSDITVTVNEPAILTTTGASSCTPASMTLNATANASSTINWYANATGGAPLANGTSYVTPVISNTTTYYVSASSGGFSSNTGMAAALPTATSGAGTTNYGIVFDALSAFTLNSVTVYPVSASSASGTVTIDVINSAGAVLHTVTANVTGSPVGTPNPTVINCNFNIVPGTNMKIRPGFTGITGLLFEPSASAPSGNYGYPYVVPGVLSINTSTLTAAPTNTPRNDLYYYFYNWVISTGCEGPRVPVVAAISTVPTSIVTTTNPVVTCTPGGSVTLSVVSSNGVLAAGGFWEYQWMDETGTTVLQPWNASSNFAVTAAAGLNKYRIYMRNSACPGNEGFDYASFVVGITGSVTGVSPTGCNATGKIVVSADGSGILTNWYNNDFTSSALGAAAAVTGTAAVTGGECVITPNATSQSGAFQVFNPSALSASNYQIDFDLGVLPSGADGISYSFGDDVSPTSTTPNFECGTGTKFKLAFDAYPNTGGNVPGIYLMYNCITDLQPPTASGVLGYANNTSWLNANTHVTIIIDPAGYCTVKLNNVAVFSNVALPASYLTTDRSTWTHVFKARTGAISEKHAIDNLVIKYNAFEYSINGSGGPWQLSNVFNNLPVGTYNVWVRNPLDTTCLVNLGNYILNYPTAIATNASDTVLCVSGTSNLSLNPTLTGATFQWDSSSVSSSGPWFPITGATNATYIAITSATTWYRCNISCGGTPIDGSPSLVREVLVNNPQVISTVPGTRCGYGTVDLAATGSAGVDLNWFATPTGGLPIGTGTTFTTPVINNTTTYYVEASTTGGKATGGRLTNPSGGSVLSGFPRGIIFNTLSAVDIDSVGFLCSGVASTVTIQLYNSGGTATIGSPVNISIPANAGTSTTPVLMTFAAPISIPAAGTYRLFVTNVSPTGNVLWYEFSGVTGYPYAVGTDLSITSSVTSLTGTASLTTYYYFYKLVVKSGCYSASRTAVTATVTAPPAIITSGNVGICQGNSTTISVSSPTNDPNYSYTWYPGGLTGSSQSVSPSVTTKYTVYAEDQSGGTNDGCVILDSLTVTVNPAPSLNLTSSAGIVCQGDSVQISSGANSNTMTNGSLTTPLTIGNSSSACGFDITNTTLNPVTIHYLHFTSSATAGTSLSESVYYSTTPLNCTAPTNVTTAPGWNLIGTVSCTSAGTAPNLTLIPLDLNLTIPPGATYAVVFGGASVAYSGTGSTCVLTPIASDANISLKMGFGGTLTSTINFRSFNGKVDYSAGSNITLNNVWTPATGLSDANISSPMASPATTTTYTVTVTNASTGCSSSGSITVNVTPAPQAYLSVGDTSLCSNDPGFYMQVLEGGAYAGGWPIGTNFNFYGAGALLYQSGTDSTYYTTTSDAYYAVVTLPPGLGNCAATSDTAVVDFGATQAPQYALTTDSVGCYGESTGNAIANITFGGTPDFRWKWYDSYGNLLRDVTNSLLYDTLPGVPAGMYTLVLTDHQNFASPPYCGIIDSIMVGEPLAPLTVSENLSGHINVLCNGALTGAIDITAAGGTPDANTNGYQYEWSNSSTSEDPTGLGAGVYTVTVSDSRGCTISLSVTITEPAAVSLNPTVNQIPCNGGTGSISLNVTGGIAPYSYEWSNSASSQSISGLTAGTYSVTVTDANGCINNETFVIDPEPLSLTLGCSSTNNSCYQSNNGTVNVSVSGGTGTYSYLWSNGSTAASQVNLAKGTYTVTVTDANGCSGTCSTTITQPALLTISSTAVDPTSALPLSGSITVNASGGTPGYSYLWDNSSTDQVRSGMGVGTYTVTVTDANGCSASKSVTLIYNCTLSFTNQVVQQPSCGKANGIATVIPSGGTSYTYAWQTSPVQTTATATGLSYYFNSYCLITDISGCSVMDTVTLPTSNGLNLVLTSAVYAGGYNIRCNGGNNGNINLTVSGSTGPYTYLWNTGATTQNLTGLTAGTYIVTVSNGGCTSSNLITLTQPAILNATTTIVNPSCFGGANGSATVTPGGGVGPYSYSWSTVPVKTSATATGLTAGVYTVTVSDANGCTKTKMVTLTQPTAVTVTGVVTNAKCFGSANGSIDITPAGGTTPYTYLWSTGSTNQDRMNVLAAGTYTVTVTDNKGCTVQYSNAVGQPTAITALITSTNVSCYGGSNGTASVTASGGSPGYTYSWNTIPAKTTAAVTGLKKGTYTVIITDSKGCLKGVSVTITEPSALSISISKTNVTTFGGSNGTATANVSGGVAPYSYSWNTIPVKSTQTVTGLSAGTYTVTVTDAKGCTKSANVTITQPAVRIADNSGGLNVINSVVFPNPTNGHFTVSFDETIKNKVNLQVFTMTGERVFIKDVEVDDNTNSFDIDLSLLPKGIYFIRYSAGNKEWVERLIIQ